MILLIKLLSMIQTGVVLLLVTRAVMSWIIDDWHQPFPQMILRLTEPILSPMRDLFYRLGLMRGGLDLSFLATILLVQYGGNFIIRGIARLI